MATLKDVAKRAGVSRMTVSRVVNQTGQVSAKTQKRVNEAIEALGYQPNKLARGMVTGSSKTIGVLHSNLYNHVYADQIFGIEEVCKKRGYSILFANAYDYESAVTNFSSLIEMQVDGIIVLPVETLGVANQETGAAMLQETKKIYEYLYAYFRRPDAKKGVSAGESALKKLLPYVEFDYAQGARLAMEYLLGCGHTDIVYVTSFWDEEGVWRERQQAYCDEMSKHSLAHRIHIERTDDNVEGGYRWMKQFIQSHDLPSAILCGDDNIAIGVIQAANEHQIRIPEQLAIMGQDGLRFGEMLFPTLSTIEINGYESGKVSADILLDWIETTEAQTKHIKIQQDLRLRRSTW